MDSISANKRFSSSKTSSRKPYSNSKQQEKQKHSAETTINFSRSLQGPTATSTGPGGETSEGSIHATGRPPWAAPRRCREAHDQEPEQYGGDMLHGQSDAVRNHFSARAGRAEGRLSQPPPPLQATQRSATLEAGASLRHTTPRPRHTRFAWAAAGSCHTPRGAARRPGQAPHGGRELAGPTPARAPIPPPPPDPPGQRAAPPTQTHPSGSMQPNARQGDPGNGPTPPPPTLGTRSKRPDQETRSGTDHLGQPHQRAARGPRKVRAQKGRGREGTRTPRECERTTTQWARGAHQKGSRTELAQRTDHLEWHTSRRGQGKCRSGDTHPLHAQRRARGGGMKMRTGRGVAPLTCRDRCAHTKRTLHLPRQ